MWHYYTTSSHILRCYQLGLPVWKGLVRLIYYNKVTPFIKKKLNPLSEIHRGTDFFAVSIFFCTFALAKSKRAPAFGLTRTFCFVRGCFARCTRKMKTCASRWADTHFLHHAKFSLHQQNAQSFYYIRAYFCHCLCNGKYSCVVLQSCEE